MCPQEKRANWGKANGNLHILLSELVGQLLVLGDLSLTLSLYIDPEPLLKLNHPFFSRSTIPLQN